MRGVFVTGTGTGVGKSVVAAAICASLSNGGERVAAFKPAVSGLDELEGAWPPDHVLLAQAASADQTPEQVAPYRFGPPVSPHLAAKLAGVEIDPERLREAAGAAASEADALVVEGIGGMLVPLTPSYLIRDFAADLALPVVIAAGPGLGTINHTLLTIEAARTARLEIAGVVLTPWPIQPGPLERSNREAISTLGEIAVETLPVAAPATIGAEGSRLPTARWLDP